MDGWWNVMFILVYWFIGLLSEIQRASWNCSLYLLTWMFGCLASTGIYKNAFIPKWKQPTYLPTWVFTFTSLYRTYQSVHTFAMYLFTFAAECAMDWLTAWAKSRLIKISFQKPTCLPTYPPTSLLSLIYLSTYLAYGPAGWWMFYFRLSVPTMVHSWDRRPGR